MIEELALKTDSKILLLVLDGVGGLPKKARLPSVGQGYTELETAKTPNLDKLAQKSITGLTDAVAPGITPGSGPAHLSLFGYNPIKYQIGRGVLEALGVGVSLNPEDIAARGNFATVDAEGLIIDRRAGRISTEVNQKICKRLQTEINKICAGGTSLPDGQQAGAFGRENVKVEVMPGKEHRFVLVFRGSGLDERITETDPQKTGNPPLICKPLVPEAEKTARIVNIFVNKAKSILSPPRSDKRSGTEPANMVLLRGFAKLPKLKLMQERFKLTPAAIATYPMYRGLASLVGMDVLETGYTIEDEILTLKKYWKQYNFFYLHIKKTDSFGEDGNFENKVKIIEEIDKYVPILLELVHQSTDNVFVITGDHSTPSLLKAHSWHPNPFLLYSKWIIPDSAKRFTERECMRGGLGHFNAVDAIPLMLAHALKLKKFGA
ncbi:2,3-bisphosphoglycerate-independent phosphoglycerate mutase [candidate division WOR-3 bacterium]|nr:2,3-bisphosphoglycerate-independent phosphoglycerate mutase [candidate division WOR-3 bacterium]